MCDDASCVKKPKHITASAIAASTAMRKVCLDFAIICLLAYAEFFARMFWRFVPISSGSVAHAPRPFGHRSWFTRSSVDGYTLLLLPRTCGHFLHLPLVPSCNNCRALRYGQQSVVLGHLGFQPPLPCVLAGCALNCEFPYEIYAQCSCDKYVAPLRP